MHEIQYTTKLSSVIYGSLKVPPRWRGNSSSSRPFLFREGKKATSYVPLTRFFGVKKTRRRDPASRQLDFLGLRRQKAEFLDLVKSRKAIGRVYLAVSDPRSRVDEMPDLVFLPSWTQEAKLTRCRSRPLVFLDPRSRVDEMPDIVF